MQILPLTTCHVPQLARLERENFSCPWDAASLLAELENPLALWLAAVEADQVLGYVGSQTVFEDADILNLCVAPTARRRGVGRSLMRELEERLAAHGAQTVTLEVRASNRAALALYESLGYAQIGLRRGYYERPREDALILQKQLKP